MSELIPLTHHDGVQAVMGRDLHEFLEIKDNYMNWFPRMIEYGFVEGQDFIGKILKSTGGRPKQDHIVALDMAKEISMIQRTERGKQARQYFLECERKAKQKDVPALPQTYSEALRELAATVEAKEALEAQAAIDTPKALFADAVSTSHTTILVGDLAKILKGNGVSIGANRLFKWLRTNGFLIARKGTDWNMPTQKAMELGLFKVKETAVTHSDGHVSVNKTPKVTGKGQQYFVQRFLDGTFTSEGAALKVVG